MLRLLTIVAAASAYPHHFYNPYYGLPVVPQPYPMVVPEPAPLARTGYQENNYHQDEQTARYLINFEAFQRVQGVFEFLEEDPAVTFSVPITQTLTGSASFYQNPFTGTNSKYRVDITGMTAGDKYVIGLQADCDPAATMPKTLQTGTAPGIQLFNTFKVYGQVDDHNIDGAGAKTKLTTMHLLVRKDSATGDVIGCTKHMLA